MLFQSHNQSSKLKAQSSIVSFATFSKKKDVPALIFDVDFENVTTRGIGCTCAPRAPGSLEGYYQRRLNQLKPKPH